MENLHYLVTDLFKVKNKFSPKIMQEIFVFIENEIYNLRSSNYLVQKNI